MDIEADLLFDGDDFTADMVISIGGDGTFLKAARRVGRKGIPILGINTGRLGFLADISPEEMEETFDEIQAGRYSVEERSVLPVSYTHLFPIASGCPPSTCNSSPEYNKTVLLHAPPGRATDVTAITRNVLHFL